MSDHSPTQVSNTMGGSECYSKRVETNLVPCLSHFAVAAGKDSLWKPLNYQLLLKTKHSKSEVSDLSFTSYVHVRSIPISYVG